MQIWANKDDCYILRQDGLARVFNADGAEFFALPSDWIDETVWRVFHVANRAYDFGHNAGDLARAAVIRAALGVTDMEREIARLKTELASYERAERDRNQAMNEGDGLYRP